MGTVDTLESPVIFFDGVCNLCNASVQFIIKRDKAQRFRYASLQSDFAKSELPEALTNDSNLQSFVLKQGETILTKSSAAFTIAKYLKGLWPILYIFIIFPKFIRDGLYDIVAKNRYNWFGKKDQCMVPTPELKQLFYD